jgi:hypothetical protein
VNRLFRMGGGPGVRISEQVFLGLPVELRAQWRVLDPPAGGTVRYTRSPGTG